MAITVGQFREFLSDSASNMSDAQGGRILTRAMQSTMRRLSREGAWNEKRRRRLVNMLPRLEQTTATAVQDSDVVTLDPAAPGYFPLERKFYDEGWNIQIDGREIVFQFAEQPMPDSMKLTTFYDGPSTPVGSYARVNLTKSKYTLPATFVQVYSVELPQEGVGALAYLSRSDFEVYRRGLLTSASQPWVYTIHSSNVMEFWPPANSARGFTFEIDLLEALRVPGSDALDEEILDWPDHMTDLLWAAGRLQLLEELGGDAVHFDGQSAQAGYARTLAIYKTEDQSRGQKVWSMSGPQGADGTPRPFGLNLRGPVRGS